MRKKKGRGVASQFYANLGASSSPIRVVPTLLPRPRVCYFAGLVDVPPSRNAIKNSVIGGCCLRRGTDGARASESFHRVRIEACRDERRISRRAHELPS